LKCFEDAILGYMERSRYKVVILPRFLIIITVSGATTSGILSESWHEVLVESVSGTCKLTGLVLFVKFSEISGGKMIDSDCDVENGNYN
jgi:hypothetical protein